MLSEQKKRPQMLLPFGAGKATSISSIPPKNTTLSKSDPVTPYQIDPGLLRKCPVFQPRFNILERQISHHINGVLENEQEKALFIEMLRKLFCNHSGIDMRAFCTPGYEPFGESRFLSSLPMTSQKDLRGLRIAAIDGGLGRHQYLGIDVTLIKAAVVIYEFQANGIPKITEYQNTPNEQNYLLYTDFHYISENISTSLAGLRLQVAENTIALLYLQNAQQYPDLIILDGSLALPNSPMGSHELPVLEEIYTLCLESYKELYRFCQKHQILIVGSVKDTTSDILRSLMNRAFPTYMKLYPHLAPFQDVMYRQVFDRFSDAELIYKLMPPKTRTVAFRYEKLPSPGIPKAFGKSEKNSQAIPGEPIIKNPSQEDLFAAYFQISPLDIPLRIEFFAPPNPAFITKKIERVAQLITPLCQAIPDCCLPIPQFEAHNRAHIPIQEFNLVLDQFRREFQAREITAWKNREILLDSKQHAILEKLFENGYDYKSFYSTFMSKRHDRIPF